ncbi:type II 3-dehydroquinate dehydratase [Bilophila wadsworthia]|uniref:type II 3-dehydroquinate dehydratase n=8 Tax=Bilophila wadsworthia TaxID=35833 RepID=UPI002432D9BE|nr:type II 3-dehydroquinate dehydratase [Bilophila wadsworthia]
MNRILVMHGVNLNLFGKRDPKHYGTETLEDINGKLSALAGELGVEVSFFQSNYEGAFVERIQEAHGDGTAGIVLNAGAWTHYSYAIMDALAILSIPAVEVHMSNVHAREAFRHFSVLSAVTRGSIAGFGSGSYLLGLRAVVDLVRGVTGGGKLWGKGGETFLEKGFPPSPTPPTLLFQRLLTLSNPLSQNVRKFSAV